jgi:hypothetical protein
MSLFGWCTGPDGARVDHEHCLGQIGGPDGIACTCGCHSDEESA